MDTLTNSSSNTNCLHSIPTRRIFTVWVVFYLLVLPLHLFILFIGFNKWKKPASSGSGLSHSDVFTLHMVSMEMINFIGTYVVLSGYYCLVLKALIAGDSLFSMVFTGQMLFHSLTCVERYLSVVHPVVYLRLRREGGVTVRNISIALVWLFSLINSLTAGFLNKVAVNGSLGFVISVLSLPVVAYCSVTVLRVLIQPKPGDTHGPRKQMSQSKRSTVYTVVAILGTLTLKLVFYTIYGCINVWFWQKVDGCVVLTAIFGVTLPSSLVLPLLFLHRAGKLRRKQ